MISATASNANKVLIVGDRIGVSSASGPQSVSALAQSPVSSLSDELLAEFRATWSSKMSGEEVREFILSS